MYRWKIYNEYNKTSSKYRNTFSSNVVHYNRPNTGINSQLIAFDFSYSNFQSHLVVGELFLLKWLEDNNYNYNMICDDDLHKNPNILNNYKTFVLNCHPEYWSQEMLQGLFYYLNNGGKTMYLGGNALYWKTTINNNQIEVRKDSSFHTHSAEKGGLWINLANYIFPIPTTEKIIGHWYDSSSYDRNNYYPYEIINSEHWIFNNITDTNIGTDNLNCPVEQEKKGPSGWEVDKSYFDPIYTIAKGKPPSDDITHNSDMIYYENTNGGKLFSAGSLVYTGSLLVDSNISQLTKNVFEHFLKN